MVPCDTWLKVASSALVRQHYPRIIKITQVIFTSQYFATFSSTLFKTFTSAEKEISTNNTFGPCSDNVQSCCVLLWVGYRNNNYLLSPETLRELFGNACLHNMGMHGDTRWDNLILTAYIY